MPLWIRIQGEKIEEITQVLRIRIRMDPELLPGSESGIIVLDPEKMKYQINKRFISHFRA